MGVWSADPGNMNITQGDFADPSTDAIMNTMKHQSRRRRILGVHSTYAVCQSRSPHLVCFCQPEPEPQEQSFQVLRPGEGSPDE